jgi:hypothetical protein
MLLRVEKANCHVIGIIVSWWGHIDSGRGQIVGFCEVGERILGNWINLAQDGD